MRKNKNKIMKMLSCLVAVGILMSAVPVAYANPAVYLPDCEIELYGDDVLSTYELKDNGYGILHIEAGVAKSDDFLGFVLVRLPKNVEPSLTVDGEAIAYADYYKTTDLNNFYDHSELIASPLFYEENSYRGKWYIYQLEPYSYDTLLLGTEYGALSVISLGVKFNGLMEQDEFDVLVLPYKPKNPDEARWEIAKSVIMWGVEAEMSHVLTTATGQIISYFVAGPWSLVLALPGIVDAVQVATGEKAEASKLQVKIINEADWQNKKDSGTPVHDCNSYENDVNPHTLIKDASRFPELEDDVKAQFSAKICGPDKTRLDKGEEFTIEVSGKYNTIYKAGTTRYCAHARIYLPSDLELKPGETLSKKSKKCLMDGGIDHPYSINWNLVANDKIDLRNNPINIKVSPLVERERIAILPKYAYHPISLTKWLVFPEFSVSTTIDKGLDWLRDPDQQKTDGDYVYWTYKGTPNVGITALVTLAFLNHGYDESDPTVKGALNWLVAQANEDGSISCDDRKVYDTSLAILPLVAAQNEAKYGNVIANARNYLISVQNDEGTGYDPSDRFYGGWGYPKDNWADLSNTQFVVMALDASGGLTGNVKGNALTFVTRCQNRKESNANYCSYDDGGFVYQPKNGGTSYGSMTAAGLWGLFLCGVNKGDGRLKDALQWLDHDHYSVSANTPIGNKWIYYYDLGLAKAYLMAEARGCEFGKTNWYEDLYAFLSKKQEDDGHWHNIEGDNSCDVLATAEAILALSVKEVPERISRLSYMVFKLHSAADLHIYDPEGRHVGLNTETGEVEIGIPDATYTENPIEIKVPNLEAGGYKAVLIGTEAGEYELEVIAKTGNKTLAEASYEGWITEGATQEMVTTISSIVGPLDVRIGTLEAVVEAEDSYSEHFSLDAGDELEIDAIDETGVLLRIEAEEECEGEIKISVYSENPTINGFLGEYKYCALEKYVDISLDVDREKIDWPIYLEVHYDDDELPENVDENTLTIYHYGNDTKWRSCNDFEVNQEENYISAELEKDELSYFGMGGLYAPIWERYSMILALMAIVIVLALGYFSVRRFVKSRRVKAMKVPERVPAEVAITIYNFDNSFRILNEREETAKILDGLDGRLASGEIKEETYNDLKSKYESKIGDQNRKIKSELERAKAYLLRIEDERTKLQSTHESLNTELQKEKGRKKKAEVSAKVAGISAEIERVDGIIKTMKEKIGVIEGAVTGE